MTTRSLFGGGMSSAPVAFDSSPASGGSDPRLVTGFRALVADDVPASPTAVTVDLTFCWDGGGSAIAANDESPPLAIDFPCEITGWTIAGKRSETGSATFTVYAGLYADFPAPVSIVASAKPTVSGAAKAQGLLAAVSTWDSRLPRGSILVANPDTMSGFTKLTLTLRARRLDITGTNGGTGT